MFRESCIQKIRTLATVLAGAALIAGCGGGAETTALPQTQLPGGGSQYCAKAAPRVAATVTRRAVARARSLRVMTT